MNPGGGTAGRGGCGLHDPGGSDSHAPGGGVFPLNQMLGGTSDPEEDVGLTRSTGADFARTGGSPRWGVVDRGGGGCTKGGGELRKGVASGGTAALLGTPVGFVHSLVEGHVFRSSSYGSRSRGRWCDIHTLGGEPRIEVENVRHGLSY